MNTIKPGEVNILVVDDDPICIFLAEKILKEFQIDSVTNGYEALEAIEKKRYDVILMDINLGDERMDGIKTMRAIRNIRKHRYTKIYAVTVYSNGNEWFVKQGFDGLFNKPLTDKSIGNEIMASLSLTELA